MPKTTPKEERPERPLRSSFPTLRGQILTYYFLLACSIGLFIHLSYKDNFTVPDGQYRMKDGTYISLLHQKLGSIYFTLGQYNEAIKEYKKGLKMLKENKEKIECKTCITDSFQLSSASFRSGLGFSYLKQGRKKKAYQESLYAEMNDLSSWEQTVENLFNIDGNHYSGLWEGHLMGTVDSLFPEGLMELRLDEKQYIDALEVAEYGRTRVLSYSISKDQKSSINRVC